jgi:hypothetical protein
MTDARGALTSLYKGVSLQGQRWVAIIPVDGQYTRARLCGFLMAKAAPANGRNKPKDRHDTRTSCCTKTTGTPAKAC